MLINGYNPRERINRTMKQFLLLAIIMMTCSMPAKAADSIFVEYAPFTIKEGVTEDQLISISQKLQEYFIDKQSGFIKRELLHLNGRKWVDIIYWANKEAAEKALKDSETNPICNEYFTIMEPIDPKTPNGGITHLQLVKSYSSKDKK